MESNLGRSRELAATIIDMVEDAIRQAHPDVDKIAKEVTYVGGMIPHADTLLYGETYYALEDDLTREIEETTARLLPDQASAVAKAIAYGLQDSFREVPSPAPARLYRMGPVAPSIFKDGGLIEVRVFHVDIAERNTIVEAMHKLNRKGLVSNDDIDATIASGYEELKELHYPSSKKAGEE